MKDIFICCYYSTIIGCIIIGIKRFKVLKQKKYQGIVFLLIVVLIAESVALFLGKQHLPNAWVINIYIGVEFLILAFIYLNAIHSMTSRKIIAALSMATIIFALYNNLFLQKEFFNSFSFVLYSLVILVFSLEFIRQKLNDLSLTLYDDALFWFSTGSIIFYTGNILVTGFLPEWLKISKPLASELYNINKSLNLLYYLLVGLGLFYAKNLNQLKNGA